MEDLEGKAHKVSSSMTVHVPGASVIVRKPRWKQLLLPEIPATRLACLTSGSFRPKLGLGILFLLIIGCIVLVLVPLFITPNLSSFIASKTTAAATITMSDFNKEAVESVAKANTNFGKDLFKTLPSDGNVVMSSYSVSSVLSMILHGASSNTALQLRQGLGLQDDKDFAAFKEGYMNVLSLLKSNENFTLNSANRIYHALDKSLDESFIQSVERYFLAEPVGMEFAKAEESRKAINDWVELQTKSKIKDLIASGSINALTKLVLVNAIYFKGDWHVKFDKSKTRKGEFHVTPDHVVHVDMMYIKQKYKMNRIHELKGAIALDMPYKGERLSMIFVLPDGDKSSLTDMEEAMSKIPDMSSLLDFNKIKNKVEVEVTLPKFKIESQLDLNEPLAKLGMTDMFDETKADFSAMTGGVNKGLYVSQVVQKAFVEVNEEGAEAAAATAGIMMMRAMPMNPQFTCDRPFAFFIKDNLTGMILFSGHVTDPSK